MKMVLNKNNEGFTFLGIFVVLTVVTTLSLASYYLYTTKNINMEEKSTAQVVEAPKTAPSTAPSQTSTEPDFSLFKTNQKINSDLNLPKDFTHENADYFFNDKKELFIKTGVGGASGLAKLVEGKWVSVASWNGYPDCATFDKAGVPFKKSTIEYQCYINGRILRASQNQNDLKEFCASIPKDSVFQDFECKNIKK